MTVSEFRRYLEAKRTVDDRSLNRWVYQTVRAALAGRDRSRPVDLLEIGCGIGTMIERLWDWDLAPRVVYTALDREAELTAAARERLRAFARQRGVDWQEQGPAVLLTGEGRSWRLLLTSEDFFTFTATAGFDLVLAHAVLDLLDLETSLPRLLGLLRPGGLYYLTLNFDGLTIFQPEVDPEFEAAIVERYHRSMDARQGGKGGHSQTGRRLLTALCQAGTEVLAAGSSDWLVWPTPARTYPAAETYFLHAILEFLSQTLLARRRAQIAAGELVFLAHQVDLCGRLASG